MTRIKRKKLYNDIYDGTFKTCEFITFYIYIFLDKELFKNHTSQNKADNKMGRKGRRAA
jgi:hypothetical protein